MERKYSFCKQHIAYVLLVSWFLQGCNTNEIQEVNNNSSIRANEIEKTGRLVFDVNDFEKGEEIGRGEYGKIFKCKLAHNGVLYALKEMDFNCKGPENKPMIIKSANKEKELVLKQLSHKNIVRLIGYHMPPQDDKMMIIMELCDMSLNAYLETWEKDNHWFKQNQILLHPTDTKEIAKGILEGLNYLHSNHRIAHRDLKPGNILVNRGEDGKIKSLHVTDFGVSKHIDRGKTISEHTVMGTPRYMAPELLEYLYINRKREGKYDAFKADIYSFGKVMYKCVTNQDPEGENLTMPIDKDKDHGIVVNMFGKSTQEEPKKRPTCAELLANLQGLTIEIPKGAVRDNILFSIKSAPEDIERPEGVIPITTVYAAEPSNTEFLDYISPTFDLPDNLLGKPYFFIQEDKELKKWLAIPPEETKNNKAIFKTKPCGFHFIGVSNLTHGLHALDTIRPGLNYRVYCESPACEKNQELIVIDRGFCENVNPISEVDCEKIECPNCKTILTKYNSIKQLIFLNTSGKITYRINQAPPPAQTDSFSAMGGKMIIYGEVGVPEKYSSFTITAEQY